MKKISGILLFVIFIILLTVSVFAYEYDSETGRIVGQYSYDGNVETWVDGELAGGSRLNIAVDSGSHLVEVFVNGTRVYSETVVSGDIDDSGDDGVADNSDGLISDSMEDITDTSVSSVVLDPNTETDIEGSSVAVESNQMNNQNTANETNYFIDDNSDFDDVPNSTDSSLVDNSSMLINSSVSSDNNSQSSTIKDAYSVTSKTPDLSSSTTNGSIRLNIGVLLWIFAFLLVCIIVLVLFKPFSQKKSKHNK